MKKHIWAVCFSAALIAPPRGSPQGRSSSSTLPSTRPRQRIR